MTERRIRCEDLLGTAVRDRRGRKVGHIFDMRGEERDGQVIIVEYLLGSGALLARIGMSVRGLLGLKPREPIRIPWNELDLSDPSAPIHTGDASEMRVG